MKVGRDGGKDGEREGGNEGEGRMVCVRIVSYLAGLAGALGGTGGGAVEAGVWAA